jgi:hypothetical protein
MPGYGDPISVTSDLREVPLPGLPCRVRVLGEDKQPPTGEDGLPLYGFVYVDPAAQEAPDRVAFPSYADWNRAEDARKARAYRRRSRVTDRDQARGVGRIADEEERQEARVLEVLERLRGAADTPLLQEFLREFQLYRDLSVELRAKARWWKEPPKEEKHGKKRRQPAAGSAGKSKPRSPASKTPPRKRR